MGTKKALIIASTKHHKDFAKILPSADDSDIEQKFAAPLKRVLQEREGGGFQEVNLLVDQGCDELVSAIIDFFSSPSSDDDLLLLYFFGYGVVDNEHTLHLLAGDAYPIRRTDGSIANLRQCIDLSSDVLREAGKSSKASKIVFMDVLWGTTISEDDLKNGNALEDKDRCKEQLARIPKLSLIVAHEVFSANYYTLAHCRELQRSGFSTHLLHTLEAFTADSEGKNQLTIDELYGQIVNQLKQDGSDLKPWKWDPGNTLGMAELMRAQRKVTPLERARNRGGHLKGSNGKTKPKKCFVISPLKTARAEWVLNHIIDPGCKRAGYEAQRSDHLLTAEIMPTVIKELRECPMTIAYLGPTDEQWSPNVMIEVGFRLATCKPIVLLREEPLEDEEPLPFDIKDRRTIYLPTHQAEMGQDLERTIENVAEYIRALEGTEERGSLWNSDHPLAHLSFKIGENSGTFLYSSPSADALFSNAGITSGLRSVDLESFIRNVHEAMPPPQGHAFLQEQGLLIGQLVAPAWRVAKNDMPVATVPIIFSSAAERKAHLPIIVEHSQQGDELFLKILYLDVSGKLTEGTWDRQKIHICDLRGRQLNEMLPVTPSYCGHSYATA